MFIVMTVDAQKLPVAAIRRIVIMVVVLVMDSKFTKFFASEITAAPRTNPRMDLERFFPITLLPLLAHSPCFFYKGILFTFV